MCDLETSKRKRALAHYSCLTMKCIYVYIYIYIYIYIRKLNMLIVTVNCRNPMIHINTQCRENAELVVSIGGTSTSH